MATVRPSLWRPWPEPGLAPRPRLPLSNADTSAPESGNNHATNSGWAWIPLLGPGGPAEGWVEALATGNHAQHRWCRHRHHPHPADLDRNGGRQHRASSHKGTCCLHLEPLDGGD